MLLRRGTVVYFANEVTALLRSMIGTGVILSLYSGMGELLFEFHGGIGVEPNQLTARWSKFLLAIGGVDAKIINEDPRHWKSDQAFDRIVCNVPFGFKQDHLQFLSATFSRLSSAGQLALFVAPALLSIDRYRWVPGNGYSRTVRCEQSSPCRQSSSTAAAETMMSCCWWNE